MAILTTRIAAGEIGPEDISQLRERLQPLVRPILAGRPDAPLYFETVLLTSSLGDKESLGAAGVFFADSGMKPDARLLALNTILAAKDESVLDHVAAILVDPRKSPIDFRGKMLASLDRLDSPKVAEIVLRNYAAMEPELKPRAVELLTQRPAWSKALLLAVEGKSVPKDALNHTQLRRLLASKDADFARSVKAIWGTVREVRNPGREAFIGRMRDVFRNNQGDARAGAVVFRNLCAQCHKIYGEGQDVGPELTANGRASFDQLLSNVLDPSLVIGEAYQATSVATADGRVLTGLQVENTPQRVVLKLQGGKVETIPRGEVEEMKVSPLSLMPEDLEKQLKPQEIIDLFAFLALDKPPTDPTAHPIPGTPPTLIK
jgi:putative heme-binding domain-containing protein